MMNDKTKILFNTVTAIQLSGNSPYVSSEPALIYAVAGDINLFYRQESNILFPFANIAPSGIGLIPGGIQLSGQIGTEVKVLAVGQAGFDVPVLHGITSRIKSFLSDFENSYNCVESELSKNIEFDADSFDEDKFRKQLLCTANSMNDTLSEFCRLESEKWREKVVNNKQSNIRQFNNHINNLLSVIEPEKTEYISGNAIADICCLVAKASGINIDEKEIVDFESVDAFIEKFQIRFRKVGLKQHWYNYDGGAFVGEYDNEKAALIPCSGGYNCIVPGKLSIKISAQNSSRIAKDAISLFPSLPGESVRKRDIFLLGLKNSQKDLLWIFLLGLLTGLLGMLTPVITGVIIGQAIPSGEYSTVFEFGLLLFTSTVAVSIFGLVQNFSMSRFSDRGTFRVQAAIWDRLLSLPASFFGKYDAGDLVSRAMGIVEIKNIISQSLLGSSLGIVVGMFNLIVALAYSWQLSIIVIIFSLVTCAFSVLLLMFQLKQQRRMQKLGGKIQGLVLQLIVGIGKIRVAGAETRAFTRWATLFADQKRFSYKYSFNTMFMQLAFSVMPLLQTSVIFYYIVNIPEDSKMSIGVYMAFSAAIAQVTVALQSMADLALVAVKAMPNYERAKPILTTPVETYVRGSTPPKLKGMIELSDVTFSYDGKSRILNDISLKIKPGQFAAVVGASGAGKSTLLRLMLGLEHPETGSIMYDETDMFSFNIKELRKQFGVVIQNGGVMQGSIYENVCGASLLSHDDVFNALKLAGLLKDVLQMPMGIHTVLPQGGGVLSGGQLQRLMIARALASNPQILFFDEATSALDNNLQAEVINNLEHLKLTRVFIAHRLSTIRNADIIYVMDKGSVVQAGTFEELMSDENSLFAKLCHRQMVQEGK